MYIAMYVCRVNTDTRVRACARTHTFNVCDMQVIEIDNAEFSYDKVVVGAQLPVVLAYGTQWSVPCPRLDAHAHALAR